MSRKLVYTEKGERDGVGKVGELVRDDGSGDQIRHALLHGYAIEVEDPPLDSSIPKPPVDAVIRKGKK